jgi:hypothetical protein
VPLLVSVFAVVARTVPTLGSFVMCVYYMAIVVSGTSWTGLPACNNGCWPRNEEELQNRVQQACSTVGQHKRCQLGPL